MRECQEFNATKSEMRLRLAVNIEGRANHVLLEMFYDPNFQRAPAQALIGVHSCSAQDEMNKKQSFVANVNLDLLDVVVHSITL